MKITKLQELKERARKQWNQLEQSRSNRPSEMEVFYLSDKIVEDIVLEAEEREKYLKDIHAIEIDAIAQMSLQDFSNWQDNHKTRNEKTIV